MGREETESGVLRDELARDRTLLANERTFLAYLRTAIMLMASGVTVLKIFGGEGKFLLLGVATTVVGVFVAVLGYARFQKIRAHIEQNRNHHK